jgi:hypothetical protein
MRFRLGRLADWFVVAVLLAGCGGARSDAGDGGFVEVDGGIEGVERADDGGFDAGSRDSASRDGAVASQDASVAQVCSCRFGFHQECGDEEICARGFVGEGMCTRVANEDVGAGFPDTKNGRCVHIYEGAFCSTSAGNWVDIFLDAMLARQGEPNQNLIREALMRGTPACEMYRAMSTINEIRLCAGDDMAFVASGRSGDEIGDWRFRPVSAESCEHQMYRLCLALRGSHGSTTNPLGREEWRREVAARCPERLPFGSPCDSDPDPIECVYKRIVMIEWSKGFGPR